MKVHLSDGEWKLMNKLWDASPRTITELTAAVKEETGYHAIDAVRHRLLVHA